MNRTQNRNAVAETFDPTVRWLVVRNFPRDDGGYQLIRVHDLYPLTLRPGRRYYDITHNGVCFAPGKDLSALRAEAGAAFELIKLRLLNAEGILAEAVRAVHSEVRKVHGAVLGDADKALTETVRDLHRMGAKVEVRVGSEAIQPPA